MMNADRPQFTELNMHTLIVRWLWQLTHWILVVLALCVPLSVQAVCSPWLDKAYFNEFYAGTPGGGNPPNFLEVYSADNAFPASWQNWTVDVYTGYNTPNRFILTKDSASACTKSNKTWVTYDVSDNVLNSGLGLVVLNDAAGNPVDAFAFDNRSPPLPWENDSGNWYPVLASSCPTLANRLTTQAGKSGSDPNQANMLIWSNQGNKDYSRIPDGNGKPFYVTSETGAGTTYTTCSTNNTNFSKTVSSPTVVPGGTATFLLTFSNVGNSGISNIKIEDIVPAGLTNVTATPSTGSGTATVSTPVNPATDPTIVNWTISTLASGATATMTLTVKVPNDATPSTETSETIYTNTAQTISGVTPAQSDSASVKVISPQTASFLVTANKYSVCTGAIGSPDPSVQSAPIVTITAKSGVNGTGSQVENFTGSVTLTTSTGHGTWSKVSGKANGTLSGNVYTFAAADDGQAEFYLVNTTSESLYVTATHVSGSNVMTGDIDAPITYAGSTLSLEGADSVLPKSYTVVAGRPHAIRATLSSCGNSGTAPTGSIATRVWNTPSINHPSTQTASVSTSSSCTTPITLYSAAPATNNLTLNFVAGSPPTTSSANFYLCTSDVGQYAINLATTLAQTASPNFTVRPFALTVSAIAAGGTANPRGQALADQVFTSAGSPFSATFDAWRWSAAADNSAIAPDTANDGIPNNNATLSEVVAAGRTSGFSASAQIKAAQNTPPTPGVLGTLASNGYASSIPLVGGTRMVNDLSYTEVGSFLLGGPDGAGSSMVKNYLDAPGVNVPTLVFKSDGTQGNVVGRFKPHHFITTVTHGCPTGAFTYSAQPFQVTVTAEREGGGTVVNFDNESVFARDVTLSNAGDVANFANNLVPAANFIKGVGKRTDVTFTSPTRVNPFALPVRASDAVDVVSSDGFTEGATNLRVGSLFIENSYGSELLALPVNLSARFWNNGQFVRNTDDSCTDFAALALDFLVGGLSPANLKKDTHIDGMGNKMASGRMTIKILPPTPTPTTRSHVDLTAGQPFLPGTGRLTLGTYRSRFIYLRERY